MKIKQSSYSIKNHEMNIIGNRSYAFMDLLTMVLDRDTYWAHTPHLCFSRTLIAIA
jgi:hypothetical protein